MSLTEADQEGLPPPSAPGAAATPVHRAYRSRHRIIAGVAGGLANAVGVAPMWSRLAFVVLTLFGGLGIALYIAAWLLLPAGPTASTPSMARRVLGLAVVPLWLLAVDGGGGLFIIHGAAGLVIALIGVAAALWTPRSVPVANEPAVVPPAANLVEEPAPVPRRPPSPVGGVTLGLALLVAAAGTAISGGSPTGVKVSFGIAAVLCGLGLVVSAWYGWARWLIVPAIVFAGVSVAGAATEGLGVHLNGSRGTSFWGPDDPSQPTPPTNLRQAGGVRIQLQGIEHPVDGVIRVGAGTVHIDAANDVRLEIHARVGIGRIELPNGSKDGYRRESSYVGGPANAPLVHYDIAVGFGAVEVDHFDPVHPPGIRLPVPDLPRGVVGDDGAGGVIYRNGARQLRDGTILLPDGSQVSPGGGRIYRSVIRVLPSGVVVFADGTQIEPDGTVVFPDGFQIEPVPPTSPTPATAPPAPTIAPATTVPASAPSSAPSVATTATTVAPQP
jgi:phage shock protein PspC (stress-responsive transcriptional regulator)